MRKEKLDLFKVIDEQEGEIHKPRMNKIEGSIAVRDRGGTKV
jgi:hypothetical protein